MHLDSVKRKTEELAKKYNYSAFMYTEYPHKSFWSREFNGEDARSVLLGAFVRRKDMPLLLYIHIPFCQTRCFYCTCHTIITQDYTAVESYLSFLFMEIDLLHSLFSKNASIPNFCEVHIGGGSPTILNKRDFDRLIEKINLIADIKKLNQFSIEIDPRKINREDLKYYHSKGINRVSFGIQDFNLDVQKAVNRVQPPCVIEDLLTPETRKYFSKGINFDIICGLPWQTKESIRETFERIVKISPERICFNHLHYSPKFAGHQVLMFDGKNGRPHRLPDLYDKKILFLEALEILLSNGYLRLGYDHFAKSRDEVAKAMQKNKMRWNALGVTSGAYSDALGIGLSSWSTIGDSYFQNFLDLPDYKAAVRQGRFPVYRGHRLSRDDMVRRDIIQRLRNFFFLGFRDVEKKYGLSFKEYFKDELSALSQFVKDGILELSDSSIAIMRPGEQFANLVCRIFDKYINRTAEAGQNE